MKIAVPTAEGRLCMHFGHCEEFALIEVDPSKKAILGRGTAVPPPHEPGVLPAWIARQGVQLVIAGGMGQRAVQLLQSQGVEVIVGAPAEAPEKLVQCYLDGTLTTGSNACDH